MTPPILPADLRHESLDVGAAPLVRHFLARLDLPGLFQRYLPPSPGRPPALPSATVLGVLLANLLLARQPLYALAAWVSRRVPEPIGLQPGQAGLLNDDRAGRALDHLHRADRASLLTALDRQARAERLRRARARLEQLRPVGRGGVFRSETQARAAGQRVLEQEQVTRWLRLQIDEEVEQDYRPAGPGRPGPNTVYRRVERRCYRVRVEEDGGGRWRGRHAVTGCSP